jgi:hypothetical protein
MVDLESVSSGASSFGAFSSLFVASGATATSSAKKAKKIEEKTESSSAILETLMAQADDFFVPPNVAVIARVQTLFEINHLGLNSSTTANA